MLPIELINEKGGNLKTFRKSELIFMEGSTCHFYHQLVSGRVSWINYDEEGHTVIQAIIQEGESFGELPLFDNGLYAANGVADTDCVVALLPKSNFCQLLTEQPVYYQEFCKALSHRLRYSLFIIKELAYRKPEKTIISLLEYFKHKKNEVSGDLFKINFTRQHIASMTGLRVETVIRTIRKLSDQGMLTIDHGKIYI